MTDEEFLMWVSNRLVNKYNEPRDILDRMIKIISKNRQYKNTSAENIKNNTLAIQNIMNYLTQLQKINNANTELVTKDVVKFNASSSLLDSIDMDSFLK